MKSLKNQVVDASIVCFGVGIICIAVSILLSGCGKTGPAGANGQSVTGPQGEVGTSGAPGSSCTVTTVQPSTGAGGSVVAPNGASLIQCPDGSQSLVLNGANGTNGTAGASGTNGTVITPVQFCPGTGSYPSTFPEVAFCINNNLYAVYSENDSFLTEILPGTWRSDGINSSCIFTVAADCKVTN